MCSSVQAVVVVLHARFKSSNNGELMGFYVQIEKSICLQ